ncbi:hypothetical protein KA005_00130 [bacterium]|nr:hypothetical protein [bacterium]
MDNDGKTRAITKVLSSTDTGETGSHQAGAHIPKAYQILSFFPALEEDIKNRRTSLYFKDIEGIKWHFSFIHYNNRYYGGTRNEYRLTGMTKYFKKYGLKTGDRLTLRQNEAGEYSIEHIKSSEQPEDVLYLGNTWKVVNI